MKLYSIKKGFTVNLLNNKKDSFVLKRLPLMALLATSFSYASSPFYPIPAYLSSKAEIVKPNVMLLMDSSGSMTSSVYENGTYRSRMAIAKEAFTALVENNPSLVRWGYSSFHAKNFTPIDDYNVTNVIDQIKYTPQDGPSTPTVSIYYQMIRYFRGLTPTTVSDAMSWGAVYGDWGKRLNNDTTQSPIQYRCQKNFIISLSDGDANGSSMPISELANDPDFATLPRGINDLPSFTGKAFNFDFKTGGTDTEGGLWDDPNYRVQNIVSYTIGFGSGMSSSGKLNLEQAAVAGGGKYYTAGNSRELIAALQDALSNITSMVRAPSPPAYTSEAKSAGAIVVKFSSANWSSELTSYNTNPDGSLTTVGKSVTIPKGGDRNVWFKSASNGTVALKTNSNSDTAATFGVTETEATNTIIPWLQNNTVAVGEKRASLLGDVLNSDLTVTNKGSLFSLSANDGMVHVFKKETVGGGYTETFAYIPSMAKRQDGGTIGKVIPNLTKSNYGKSTNLHRYLADGGSFYRGVADGDKHFVVGTTGRGAAGVYALDMKNIRDNGSGQNSVVFDKTQNDGGYNNLGYTVSTPVVAKVQDGGTGKWVALVANGYFSQQISLGAEGRPALYAINLEGTSKGDVWREISVSESDNSISTKNGLSGLAAIDSNNDGYVDFVYAGDLKGDLYRFDLRRDPLNDHANRSHVVKVFKGRADQPITSAPAVYKRADGKLTIIFGTGSLLEESDNTNKDDQTVYGIIDDLSVTGNLTAATQHPITADDLATQATVDVDDTRMLTTHNLADTDKGWKLNLSSGTGERVVYQPVVYGRTVFLTTQMILSAPKNNQGIELLCAANSSSGYVMSIDAETGGMPKAKNAHFAGANYLAGSKVNGAPSKVGGLNPVNLSQSGTNVDDQILFGLITSERSLIAKDASYTGGTFNAQGVELTSLITGLGGNEDDGDKFLVLGPVPIKHRANVRTLSWREIF